jgi:hypothetical protein
MLTREYLAEIRYQALRKRIWYKTLDDIERSIFSLSVTVCNKIHSNLLNIQLEKIIAKLKNVIKSEFVRYFERFGIARMITIQKQAIDFGYNKANGLKLDYKFLRYLMFLDYNQPMGWGIYSSQT